MCEKTIIAARESGGSRKGDRAMLREITMFFVKQFYKSLRKKNPTHALVFIVGTGKDYPNFMVYTESESWSSELKNVCDVK